MSERSDSVKAGIAEAASVKERWTTSLVTGEVTFQVAVEYSKTTGPEKHLSTLRLYDILRARKGWTDITAMDALTRNGFSDKDNIRSIRRSPRKVDRFALLMASTADRWRARPEPPKGWPWSGKLALLIESAGEKVPSILTDEPPTDETLDPELEALLAGDDEEEPDTGEDVERSEDDVLSALLDGGDVEED